MRLPYQLGIQMSNQYEHVHQYDLWTPEQSPDHAESESVTWTLTRYEHRTDATQHIYIYHWLTVDESTSISLISYLKWRIGESTSSCHARDATADHDDWWRRCAPTFNSWEQKAWTFNFFNQSSIKRESDDTKYQRASTTLCIPTIYYDILNNISSE